MRNEWSPLRPPFGTRRTAGAACEANKGPARRRSSVSIERKFWMWRASLRAATRNTSGFEWEFRPAVAVSCVALHAFTAWNIYRSTSRQNGAPLASVALHIFPSISLFAPGAIFLLARGICIFASDVFHPECGWGLGTESLSIAGTCVNCCAGHRKKSCRTRPRGATKNWSDCFIYLVCCIRSWQSFQWEKEQTENICKKLQRFFPEGTVSGARQLCSLQISWSIIQITESDSCACLSHPGSNFDFALVSSCLHHHLDTKRLFLQKNFCKILKF